MALSFFWKSKYLIGQISKFQSLIADHAFGTLGKYLAIKLVNPKKTHFILMLNSEGIYGSTDFAKSRILQEGGKTIEALF